MKTHRMSQTLIYLIWKSMIKRCENPRDKDFKHYGGRGIKVCGRWRSSFENFYVDVGNPPEGKTLDRWPDNDGDYEFTNFRWASPKQQANNRRPKSCGPMKQHWFFAFNLDTGGWFEGDNQRAFARKHELCQANISACLLGKQKAPHKGWTFEFLP